MAKGALFTAVWARCPQHQSVVLEPGEQECINCKIVRRNFSLRPPFKVYATAPFWGKFEVGHIYEVHWIVKDMVDEYGMTKSGFIFQNQDKSIWEHLGDPTVFIPVEFLTEDNKDSWLSEK